MANTMTSSAPHAPPRLFGASQSVTAAPPETSIVFNFPSAKNPRERLSGEKNGEDAPSVPANGRGVARQDRAPTATVADLVGLQQTQRGYRLERPPVLQADPLLHSGQVWSPAPVQNASHPEGRQQNE